MSCTVEYIPAPHLVSNILWDVVDVTWCNWWVWDVCNFGLPGACNAQPSNRSQNLSCQLFGLGLDLAQTWVTESPIKAGSESCLPQSNILMKSKNFDTSSSSKHSRKGRNVFKTITWAELHQRLSNAVMLRETLYKATLWKRLWSPSLWLKAVSQPSDTESHQNITTF